MQNAEKLDLDAIRERMENDARDWGPHPHCTTMHGDPEHVGRSFAKAMLDRAALLRAVERVLAIPKKDPCAMQEWPLKSERWGKGWNQALDAVREALGVRERVEEPTSIFLTDYTFTGDGIGITPDGIRDIVITNLVAVPIEPPDETLSSGD